METKRLMIGSSPEAIRESIEGHCRYSLGKLPSDCAPRDIFQALALAVRDRLMDGMITTSQVKRSGKNVYLLSMEYLQGRLLGNSLINLGIYEACRQAVEELGADLEALRELESDAALGCGECGLLAANLLESLATQGIPATAYGLLYEFGMFNQVIEKGFQKEQPNSWLAMGSPFLVPRYDQAVLVPFYGRVEPALDRHGRYAPMWMDATYVVSLPHDVPVAGFGGGVVNTLRLFAARTSTEFDMGIASQADYLRAVDQKIASERISKIYCPPGVSPSADELRLCQEYFLVASSLRDLLRRYEDRLLDDLPREAAIHLNGAQSALAVAELLRLLVDEMALSWEAAWDIVRESITATGYTVRAEDMEKWPVALLEKILPRHLQLIYEINHRFLQQVSFLWPNDLERLKRASMIEEGAVRQVRFDHMAMVGAHSVAGLSQAQTRSMLDKVAPDFEKVWPDRFHALGCGISPRRWILKANPLLADLLRETIGDGFLTDLDKLAGLTEHADDTAFQETLLGVKRANKERLSRYLFQASRVRIDPDALLDVQAKRVRETSRQLLNVLAIIHEYLLLVEDRIEPAAPRTYLFTGRATPGDWIGKQIIKLIHAVGQVVNEDPRVKGWMKVVFMPDYRISVAEKIIPAADLCAELGAPGLSASAAGMIKFALGGALLMGSRDGVLLDIAARVGSDKVLLFGQTIAEAEAMRQDGGYLPWEFHQQDEQIRRTIGALRDNRFCAMEPGMLDWVHSHLFGRPDPCLHLVDFEDLRRARLEAGELFANPPALANKVIETLAGMGPFSVDETLRGYCRRAWGITITRA